MIDQAVVLFGMPEAVTAHLKAMRTGGEIVDWFEVRLHYHDKSVAVRGSCLCRMSARAPLCSPRNTRIICEAQRQDPQEATLKGGLHLNPSGEKNTTPSGILAAPKKNGTPLRTVMETLPGNYIAYYDNIAACIRHGGVLYP